MIIRIECPFCKQTHKYFKPYWNMLELIQCHFCNREFHALIKVERNSDVISLSFKTLKNISAKAWGYANSESNQKKW